jgi:uncharacterized protein (TIGR02271 family)
MKDEMPRPDKSFSIPVIQEEVQVEKKVVEKGRVKLIKTVKEETESLNLPEINEEVHIERVPLNKIVEKAPEAVRYEGDTMIIPVLKEIAVIEKKVLLIEEIRVTKTAIHSEQKEEVTLRKEEINIERSENNF